MLVDHGKMKKDTRFFLNLVWKTFPQEELSLNPHCILFHSHPKSSLNILIHPIISDFHKP